jgi:hypothetical protein
VTDQQIEKWKLWCEGTIANNVHTMHLQRAAWREVAKIIDDNGQLPDSYWWEFMRDTYATTQAVAVRRQADTHRDAASLGRLIQEIRDDAETITEDFWVGLWTDPMLKQHVAPQAWSEQYAGETRTHLDASIPAADLRHLKTTAAEVKNYVDESMSLMPTRFRQPSRSPSRMFTTPST